MAHMHRSPSRIRLIALIFVGTLLSLDSTFADPADGRASTAGSTAASAPATQAQAQPATCSLGNQLQSLRLALRRGSPALQRYLRRQLRELAPAMPESELRAAFEHEHDPALIEELSAALAARMARLSQPQALRAPLVRAQSDRDPEARAAALRGLRGTASVEAMASLGVDYQELARDEAKVVRRAIVENLLAESAEVFHGHDRAVSEKAIAVALALRSGKAADPAQAAQLLSKISTESIGHAAVHELLSILSAPLSENPAELRAAVVTALGGVPASEAAAVREALLAHYRHDKDRDVRRAVLEALCHLFMAAAIPIVESLRSVDSSLGPEITAWQRALASGLQEWALVLREKQHILPSPPAPHSE